MPHGRSRSRARRASRCSPRGGGTSQCGQTVNDSLVIDCSKYLNRILELDVEGRRCVVEPGIVLDDLNRALKPHGLWFPVDISTASRATIGGMAGEQFLRRALAALRQHARERHLDRRDARRWRARTSVRVASIWPNCRPIRRSSAGQRSARARRARSRRNRGALSESAAPGRRLQSRCAAARAQRPQPRAYPGRLRRHARLHHENRAEALRRAGTARGRRLPFRPLLRRDGCGPAYRSAEADRRSN